MLERDWECDRMKNAGCDAATEDIGLTLENLTQWRI